MLLLLLQLQLEEIFLAGFVRRQRAAAAADFVFLVLDLVFGLGFLLLLLSLVLRLLIRQVLPPDTLERVIFQRFLLHNQHFRLNPECHRFCPDKPVILFGPLAEVVEFLQHLQTVLARRRRKVPLRRQLDVGALDDYVQQLPIDGFHRCRVKYRHQLRLPEAKPTVRSGGLIWSGRRKKKRKWKNITPSTKRPTFHVQSHVRNSHIAVDCQVHQGEQDCAGFGPPGATFDAEMAVLRSGTALIFSSGNGLFTLLTDNQNGGGDAQLHFSFLLSL